MKFRHNFHADGEYRFTIPDLGVDLYTRVVETRHAVILFIDGRVVFREYLGGLEDMKTLDRGGAPGRAAVMKRFTNIPIQVKAGTRDVAVTFIERARVESDEFVGFLPGDLFSRGDRCKLVDGVQVVGRYSSGVSETTSRRRVSCWPPKAGPTTAMRARIASTLLAGLQRPVTEAEIGAVPFFDGGRKSWKFRRGIQQVIAPCWSAQVSLSRGSWTRNTTASAFPLNTWSSRRDSFFF
jgi:hypothetical protein